MYTEDDKELTVKKNNSNTESSDFYTLFNTNKEKEQEKINKNPKKKGQNLQANVLKEERDYSDFYGTDDEVNIKDDKDNNNNKGNKKFNIMITVAIILFALLIGLIIVLVKINNKPRGDIELSSDKITINIGDSGYISYKVVNTESEAEVTFTSSNPNVAMVNQNGQITAYDIGDAVITISYTIDGITKEKKCMVIVNNDKHINENVSLLLTFEKGSENEWTNGDVVINTKAESVFGITSVEYAINCDNNCNYTDVLNNKITISKSGTSVVKVLAKDKKNHEAVKEVNVKIDKEAPSVILSNTNKNISTSKEVEICATCSDTLSGCKQNKVCKKYTSSKSNQVITVEDNAGNKQNSSSFNISINKLTAPCSLKISSDGIVTATLHEAATYYGFNSNYTGNNELSKKITIGASKKGESGAKLVYYYVKNKNGTVGNCFITVIKKCNCTDLKSTNDNCPVTCTFTSQ